MKKRGLENKIFLVGSRDKALEMGLEDVVPQKLKFFLYNGTHFCIKVAIGNFFLLCFSSYFFHPYLPI